MSKRGLIGLGPELEKRLAAYATAGVAVLAIGSTPAESAVVYTKAHKLLPPLFSVATIDLDHDGIIDFSVVYTDSLGTETLGASVAVDAASNNQFAINKSMFASAVALGATIGPNLNFGAPSAQMLYHFSFSSIGDVTKHEAAESITVGPFANVTNKFLALKLVVGDKPYYGWARIDTKITGGEPGYGEPGKVAVGLLDYAYETVPNTPITAGEGIKSDSEPDTLGWLAVGAGGLRVLRSKPSQ